MAELKGPEAKGMGGRAPGDSTPVAQQADGCLRAKFPKLRSLVQVRTHKSTAQDDSKSPLLESLPDATEIKAASVRAFREGAHGQMQSRRYFNGAGARVRQFEVPLPRSRRDEDEERVSLQAGGDRVLASLGLSQVAASAPEGEQRGPVEIMIGLAPVQQALCQQTLRNAFVSLLVSPLVESEAYLLTGHVEFG